MTEIDDVRTIVSSDGTIYLIDKAASLDWGDTFGETQKSDVVGYRIAILRVGATWWEVIDRGFAVCTIDVMGKGDLQVMQQDIVTHCTDPSDPGGTEITSDVEYTVLQLLAFWYPGDIERQLKEGTKQLARDAQATLNADAGVIIRGEWTDDER